MKRNQSQNKIELLEDIADLEKAKKISGKSISLKKYLKKRGIQNFITKHRKEAYK